MPERSRKRVRTLQPDCTDAMLLDDAEVITDRQILNDLRIVILCWTHARNDLPEFFDDEFQIKSVVRQVVSSVVVYTQKMRRKISHEAIAYDNEKLHESPLPTQNLFELEPIDQPFAFPSVPTKKRQRIEYNEMLCVCASCDGAGEIECKTCEGSAFLSCGNCDGVGEVRCSNCSGTGERVIGATRTSQCSTCSGKGSRTCSVCRGKGGVRCGDCQRGSVKCDVCAASGFMRNLCYLDTQTSTQIAHRLYCKNEWVDESSEIATDSVLMRHQNWKEAHRGVPRGDLRALVPAHLVVAAEDTIIESADQPTNTSLDSAIRVEARAAHVYHVVVEHNGQFSEFFVSGCSNSVTPHVMPQQSKKLFSRLTRMVAPRTTQTDFIRAVRDGHVYLADARMVGLLIEQSNVEIELDADGYQLTFPSLPTKYRDVEMGFFHDGRGRLVVQSSILLGDADRDYFPEALSLNQELIVGQIGLVELSGGAIEQFYLVDRQRYDTLSVPHYLYLLRKMLATASHLRTEHLIGLRP